MRSSLPQGLNLKRLMLQKTGMLPVRHLHTRRSLFGDGAVFTALSRNGRFSGQRCMHASRRSSRASSRSSELLLGFLVCSRVNKELQGDLGSHSTPHTTSGYFGRVFFTKRRDHRLWAMRRLKCRSSGFSHAPVTHSGVSDSGLRELGSPMLARPSIQLFCASTVDASDFCFKHASRKHFEISIPGALKVLSTLIQPRGARTSVLLASLCDTTLATLSNPAVSYIVLPRLFLVWVGAECGLCRKSAKHEDANTTTTTMTLKLVVLPLSLPW